MQQNSSTDTPSLYMTHTSGEKADLEQGMPLARQITLTHEQFEKLYLQPGGIHARGDLTKRFANPTLLGLTSLIACLAPTTYHLMGWGSGTSNIVVWQTGPYYFLGVGGMGLTAVFEFILGNTLPCSLFFMFALFYGATGYNQDPSNNIVGLELTDTLMAQSYFYFTYGILTLAYAFAALRINICTVMQLFALDVGFWCLGIINMSILHGQEHKVVPLERAAGAMLFITVAASYYLLVAIVLELAGLPVSLPVGDLSNFLSRKPKATRGH